MTRQVALMGIQAELDLADAARDRQLLSGPRHAHRVTAHGLAPGDYVTELVANEVSATALFEP
jgi:hypothetical protein